MRTLCLLVLISGAADADELPLLAAARKREAATRSVEFVCRQTKTVPRGGFNVRVRGPRGEPQPPVYYPPEEQRVESTLRLILDGDRRRYENTGPLSNDLVPSYKAS